MSGSRVTSILAVPLLLAGAALGTAGATASPKKAKKNTPKAIAPKRGSWYRDRGAGEQDAFTMRLVVSGDRRRVTVTLDNLNVGCGSDSANINSYDVSVATISPRGGFTATINDSIPNNAGKLKLKGQFFSNGSVRGSWKAAYREPFSGCDSSGTWGASRQKGKPPAPRPTYTPARFTGTTAGGQPVTLFRTSAGVVANPSFGKVACTNSDGSQAGVTESANDVTGFSARIGSDGRFSGQGITNANGTSDMVNASGQLTSPTTITGKYSYQGADNCQGGDTFTATIANG